jgi:hypothetical protein
MYDVRCTSRNILQTIKVAIIYTGNGILIVHAATGKVGFVFIFEKLLIFQK